MFANDPSKTGELANHILIIESVEVNRRRLKAKLQRIAGRVTLCGTAHEAVQYLIEFQPDAVLTSLELTDIGGPAVINLLIERTSVPVIAITSITSIHGAVEAIRRGAADYLDVQSPPDQFSDALAKALNEARTSTRFDQVMRQVKDRSGFSSLLTQSPRMLEVFDQVRKVAGTDATVLIRGETGTGKELISRAIHERSTRADKPFIAVNCGAFTESLLESELFGHERGSFTGAVGRREGLFEMADGGSLFLDELGETSLNVQVNLLRVLEEMRFRRVGGRDSIRVDVRIIAATNVELETAVEEKKFREDLYYRLNVYPIFLPPMRARPEDIPLLMRHFLDEISNEYELEAPVMASDALAAAMAYEWPGNVRQLRALCERWVITRSGQRVEKEHLPNDMTGGSKIPRSTGGFHIDDSLSLRSNTERAVQQIEKVYLHRILKSHKGRLEPTAKAAGMTRRTLYSKMKQYGLNAHDYREASSAS
jgi:DNA-binding NtrC family response regulator